MKNIRNFTEIYDNAYSVYKEKQLVEDNIIAKNNAKILTAEKSIIRAKDRKYKIPFPHWTKLIIENIAKEMLQYFPDRLVYEIYGPFGLGAHTSIWINHPEWDLRDDEKKQLPHYFFEFSPDLSKESNSTLSRINRNINNNEFAQGTIGELNGFNHPIINIPNETSVKNLILMFYPNLKL